MRARIDRSRGQYMHAERDRSTTSMLFRIYDTVRAFAADSPHKIGDNMVICKTGLHVTTPNEMYNKMPKRAENSNRDVGLQCFKY